MEKKRKQAEKRDRRNERKLAGPAPDLVGQEGSPEENVPENEGESAEETPKSSDVS